MFEIIVYYSWAGNETEIFTGLPMNYCTLHICWVLFKLRSSSKKFLAGWPKSASFITNIQSDP